ncbi:MAG: hypothetical protein KME03_12755 [Aphanocapsa lilacina HA4352-LM1]|nr:hypothetical protein [Aphanocapsa lilacina HA4352-LM1]
MDIDEMAAVPRQAEATAELAAEPQIQTRLSAQIATAKPAQADPPQKPEKPFKPLAMDFFDGDAAESYDP